jgi:hypothetical protein
MKTPKLKASFKLTDYVDPHIIKIYVLSLVSILVIALLVILGFTIFRMAGRQTEEEQQGLYSEEDISAILKSPGLTDFIIPESLESGESGFSLYREPMKNWTDEMVERYIIPPEALGIDKLQEENRKTLERILEDIP